MVAAWLITSFVLVIAANALVVGWEKNK